VLRLGRYEETLFTSLASTDVPRRFDEYAFAAVVADGIGRDGAGAMAARLAISTLAHLHLRLGSWSMRVDSLVASEIMERTCRPERRMWSSRRRPKTKTSYAKRAISSCVGCERLPV
jgi:hypothetical protein